MEHVFKSRPLLSNAPVAWDFQVSTAHARSWWCRIDPLSVYLTMNPSPWKVTRQFWTQTVKSDTTKLIVIIIIVVIIDFAEGIFLCCIPLLQQSHLPRRAQLASEKVKAEKHKSHISFKYQQLPVHLKPDHTQCYICHHNVPSGPFRSSTFQNARAKLLANWACHSWLKKGL